MKKILTFLIFFFFITSPFFTNASFNKYENSSNMNSFINSPSITEIELIEDKVKRVCERIFLEAFMRREFSDLENRLCSDIFELKMEAQLNYMRYMMWKRGIY